MSGRPVCPECATPVGVDWEWCHHCGFDPDGKRPSADDRPASVDPPAPAPVPEPMAPATAADPFAALSGPLPASSLAFESSGSVPDPDGLIGSPPRPPSLLSSGPLPPAADLAPLPDLDDPPGYASSGPSPYGMPSSYPDLSSSGSPSYPSAPSSPFPSPFETDEVPGAPGAFADLSPLSPLGPSAGDPFGLDAAGPPPPLVGSGAPLAGGPASGPGSFAGHAPTPSGWDGRGSATRPVGAPGGRPVIPLGASPAVRLPKVTFHGPVMRGGLVVVAIVAAVALLTGALVKLGGPDRSAVTSTTLDPNAPPPLGQVTLQPRGTASPTTAPTGWSHFRSSDGTFAVDFPSRPETGRDNVMFDDRLLPSLTVTLGMGTDGAGFGVEYLEFPTSSTWADSQQAFDHIGGTFTQTGTFEFAAGSTGVQFSADIRGHAARGVLLLKGRRLYILTATDLSDADYDQFLRSFKVLADPPG